MQPDPLLDPLRELPTIAPDPALTDRVARAALTALHGDSAPAPQPGWRSYLEFALFRAAVPSALAGATILYLSWAVRAASHLY